MRSAMASEKKSMDSPDETRTFEHGELRTVTLGNFEVARGVFQPGWKWSEHIKPLAQTDSCQVKHTGYVISGRLKIVMDDGSEMELGPGDAYVIEPGHDGWVVGDEPYVGVDVSTETVEKFAKEAGVVEKAKDKLGGQ